MKDVKEYSV